MTSRICFLVEDFWPVVHGATTQIMLLSERLAQRGSSSIVLTRKINRDDLPRERLNGYEVVRVPPAVGLNRWGKYLMIPTAMWGLFRNRRSFDILIVCDFKVLGIWGILAARLLRKRVFLRAESCGEMDGSFATKFGPSPSRLQEALIRYVVRVRNWLLNASDGYLSISSAITAEMRAAGVDEGDIIEITNGADLARFRPVTPERRAELRRQLGWGGGPQVLFTGRIAQGKGLQYLLAAWSNIATAFPDAHLTLVGSGQGFSLGCEVELKDQVRKLGLTTRVSFTGNVENVEDYLQAADIFVFPSESEGLGLSLVEAMAAGLPCIASHVGGIVDVVDDGLNGVLVPPADSMRLQQAIESLIKDPGEAQRLGLEARCKTERKFDIDQIAKLYLDLPSA